MYTYIFFRINYRDKYIKIFPYIKKNQISFGNSNLISNLMLKTITIFKFSFHNIFI